jgi:hypothetical protein
VNNKLYIIHAEYKQDKIRDVSLVKQWLGVDTVFRQHSKGTFIFCEEIEDIDWEQV